MSNKRKRYKKLYKRLTEIKSRQMKSHTKVVVFSTLDVVNMKKLIV